jgi:aryl-alcohol dehydrogenase-like predicted oxidoreductase
MGAWPSPGELRVGLGCMRLSTDEDRNDARALATVAAALDAGVTVFDTARAYDRNEQLLARALRAAENTRVVTKGGMSRVGGAWVPDGRARSIRADCEESLEALDGLPIDLFLLHAPDPRTPLKTSVRALARLADDGLVRHVGLCNVNRAQLDEAVELASMTAVQVAVNPFDDRALRGGVVERCSELGVTIIAHSPLGGPRRARGLARHETLATLAAEHDASVAEVALAWLLQLGPHVVVIPGARRPEAVRSAVSAANLRLADEDLERLARPRTRHVHSKGTGDVVIVMGVPGAGKSQLAAAYVERGYLRLNRDERGGSLRDVSNALDDALASGTREVVLDNTYLTRAGRSYVVDAAVRHGVAAHCVWIDTPLAQAQVNLVERLLERFGALPDPKELEEAARDEPGLLTPTQQMRAFRQLEPPGDDEGFASVDHVPFVRLPMERRMRGGVFVAAPTLGAPDWKQALAGADPAAPHLVFDWKPGASHTDLDAAVATVAAVVSGPVEEAICPHPGGPPMCWCRPPLPGLPLAFARRHFVDPAQSFVVGTSPAHRTLARTLGARYISM